MELTAERLAKFKRLIQNAPSRVIIIRSHIDLDSLACPPLMQEILSSFGKTAELYSAGKPGHPQNQLVLSSFHLTNYQPVSLLAGKRLDDEFLILLDSPSFEDTRLGITIPRKPNIVVDHHERPANMEEDEDSWYWHQASGACASLAAKLMFELGIKLGTPDPTAALGIIGIFGDTDRLISRHTTELDREMVAALGRHADQNLIHEIFFSARDTAWMEMIHRAYDPLNFKRGETALVSGLGEIPAAYTDYMATIADELIKQRGITTVYVWAIVDGRVEIKARTYDKQLDLNQHLKDMFGEKNGGARDRAVGAAHVDLGITDPTTDRESLVKLWKNVLEQKLLH
ncbi:MAG: hypothetical protein AAB731_03875 [Patescibacteria group bacterium]